MKVLKLSTDYSSRYAEVHEHVLMPIQANGSIFSFVPLNESQTGVVGLGELEGKHSYCHGDLIAEVIDIAEMNPVHLHYLIKDSDYGTFEGFFENSEYQLNEYLTELDMEDEDDLEEFNEIKNEEQLLYEFLGMKPLSDETYYKSSKVYDQFIKQLKEYSAPRKVTEINILESEAEQIKVLLLQNGFEFWD